MLKKAQKSIIYNDINCLNIINIFFQALITFEIENNFICFENRGID